MVQMRAQVVLQGGSGLPEDRFVNVFHFITPGTSYETDSAAVASALRERYQAIQAYLSEYVLPAAEIRTYNLADAEPREPTIYPLPLTIQTTLSSIPNEVAVCLSFHGAPPHTARRRGRVFLGPWNVSVMTAASSTAPPRPHSGFLTQLQTFGTELLLDNLGWMIYSPTDNVFVPVTGGWVDDEFDTMRSRGVDAVGRLQFGA